MKAKNKMVIKRFIEQIWNENKFDQISTYLSFNFVDHSLPPGIPANKEGLIQWVTGTGKSFNHKTTIEQMVAEDDKVMIKINMQLEHIGAWRAIEPTGLVINAVGYRYFKLSANRITEHWGLMDGNAIENQLKKATNGCRYRNKDFALTPIYKTQNRLVLILKQSYMECSDSN